MASANFLCRRQVHTAVHEPALVLASRECFQGTHQRADPVVGPRERSVVREEDTEMGLSGPSERLDERREVTDIVRDDHAPLRGGAAEKPIIGFPFELGQFFYRMRVYPRDRSCSAMT
jgi:hypothetical protein